MHVFSELYHITINSINSNITFDVYHESKDTTWIDGKGYLAYILVSYVTYLQKLWTIESTTFIVSRLMASYHLLSSKSFGLQATQRLCTITSQLLRTCMVQTLLFGPINQSLLHPCVLGTQCTLVVEAGWSRGDRVITSVGMHHVTIYSCLFFMVVVSSMCKSSSTLDHEAGFKVIHLPYHKTPQMQ